MAKNFKNLNSKEKYEYLFNSYKMCIDCEKMKSYNCFFDRKTLVLGKVCKICKRRQENNKHLIEVLKLLKDANLDVDGI